MTTTTKNWDKTQAPANDPTARRKSTPAHDPFLDEATDDDDDKTASSGKDEKKEKTAATVTTEKKQAAGKGKGTKRKTTASSSSSSSSREDDPAWKKIEDELFNSVSLFAATTPAVDDGDEQGAAKRAKKN